MKKAVHLIASVVAMGCIAAFMFATIVVELLGTAQSVALVKSLVVSPGLFVLVPALVITGMSGFAMASTRQGRLLTTKKKRMPFVAANGVLVLIPAALFLDQWAASGAFDTRFYIVQLLEWVVGGINLVLMGRNMRDGFRLSGRFR